MYIFKSRAPRKWSTSFSGPHASTLWMRMLLAPERVESYGSGGMISSSNVKMLVVPTIACDEPTYCARR